MHSNQRTSRLAIVVAVESEMARIRRRLARPQIIASPVGMVWEGRLQQLEVVLLRCGMGPQRVTAGLNWLSQHYTLSGVLSAGFAGGLQPQLETGDGVLVTNMRGIEARAVTDPLIVRPEWRQVAKRAADQLGLVWQSGALLSSPVVISRVAHKQQIGLDFQALAVDMESYYLGCVAVANDLPFISLRTIFDMSQAELDVPAEAFTTADGRVHAGRLLRYITCHPQALLQFPSLWHKARLAGRNLDTWLDQFLTVLSLDVK